MVVLGLGNWGKCFGDIYMRLRKRKEREKMGEGGEGESGDEYVKSGDEYVRSGSYDL